MGKLLLGNNRQNHPQRGPVPVVLGVLLFFAVLGDAAAQQCNTGNPPVACLPNVTVTGNPISPEAPQKADYLPSLSRPGTGLCAGFRPTTNATSPLIFPDRDTALYPDVNYAQGLPDRIDAFMDSSPTIPTSDPQRQDQTMQTPFDLTNHFNMGGLIANGDWVGTSGCQNGMDDFGCDFPASAGFSTTGPFAARFRGFFFVRPDWAGQPLHMGFLTDNLVALRFYAVSPSATSEQNPPPMERYLLISRHHGSVDRFRVTNQIIFPKSGLYPVEIFYGQYDAGTAGVLEFAVLTGSFNDIDENGFTGKKLTENLFDLSFTQPTNFYQTTWGRHPFISSSSMPGQCVYDLNRCQQCPRSSAGAPAPQPGSTCDKAHYCNIAAVCAPCVTNQHCGSACEGCTAPNPACIPDKDCPENPDKAHCDQCLTNSDCPSGQICTSANKCVPAPCCETTPFAVNPDPKNPNLRLCSPCNTDADCTDPNNPLCDKVNARCIDKIPENEADDKCGPNAVNCKTKSGNTPYCLNGSVCVECRADSDCSNGNYCESGSCRSCVEDRHCGPRCQSCGTELITNPADSSRALPIPTNTPFCYAPDHTVPNATCVRCITNEDCGDGGQCDPNTHDCLNKCDPPCGQGLRCHGGRCIECFNSSQCLCGACDLESGSCTANCKDNKDCQGNQCCRLSSDGLRRCTSGRCAGTAGGALCGCSTAAVAPAIVTNNTFSSDGTPLTHDRGALAALFSMLLFSLVLQRGWARRKVG